MLNPFQHQGGHDTWRIHGAIRIGILIAFLEVDIDFIGS
jgi:hypothetical protein